MRDFLIAGALQFVAYFVVTLNYRAISAGMITEAIITDSACALVSFYIVKRITQHEGYWTLVGMIVGGGLASALAILATPGWGK